MEKYQKLLKESEEFHKKAARDKTKPGADAPHKYTQIERKNKKDEMKELINRGNKFQKSLQDTLG